MPKYLVTVTTTFDIEAETEEAALSIYHDGGGFRWGADVSVEEMPS